MNGVFSRIDPVQLAFEDLRLHRRNGQALFRMSSRLRGITNVEIPHQVE